MDEQPQVSSDDKLWAALGYPIPIIALILLLMEEKRDVYFLKYHAVQSVILNIAIWVLIAIVVPLTLGFAAICAPVLWLVTLWPAYDSYQGNLTELPVITDFMKKQNWA
jgi:uncharacterized membrane protein